MSEFTCLKCHQLVAWRMLPSFKDPCKTCGRYVDVVKPEGEQVEKITPMPKVKDSSYPDIEICSRCHDNAVFTQDVGDYGIPDEDAEWLSECCGARAVSPDDYERFEDR